MKYKKRLDPSRALVFTLFVALSSCAVDSGNRASNRTKAAAAATPNTYKEPNISDGNRRVLVRTGTHVNDVRNVDGRVIVERGASARNIHTYNGRVVIEGNSSVTGNVETHNGGIKATGGAEIKGNMKTFNGNIELANVVVGRNVKTANGRIDLYNVVIGENVETNGGTVMLENSIVEKDLIVQRRKGLNLFQLPVFRQKVVIGPESQIKGSIIIRRKVQLYVHETAMVGEIVGGNAISYSRSLP